MNADEILALITASGKPFYVYELRRPDSAPFYVGAGQGKRLFDHERRVHETASRGHKNSLIRKILRNGGQIDYRIVEFFATWEEAAVEEIRLIAHYGRLDKGTGFLLNLSDGGDGVPGIIWEFTEARQAGARRAAEKNRNGTPATKARQAASAKRRGSQPFIEGARKWREQNMDQIFEERQARWRDPENHKKWAKAIEEKLGQPVIAAGVRYASVSAAALALGVSRPTIKDRIRRRLPGYWMPPD